MITFLRRKFPELKKKYYAYWGGKPINNYYNTTYTKHALLSYLTQPFKQNLSFTHTNKLESRLMARALKKSKFNVDIVDFRFRGSLDYTRYDLIIGFGHPLTNYFYQEKTNSVVTVYYSTGKHYCFQNHATLQRIRDVYQKRKVWLPESSRMQTDLWPEQIELSDYIIVIGDRSTAKTYEEHVKKHVFNIPLPIYQTKEHTQLGENRDFVQARENFIWLGGHGLIHKGLDLLLDAFVKKPRLNLHVCGPIDEEPRFKQIFYRELFATPNIHTHGFIDTTSPRFNRLARESGFVILPSCSEGQSGSIATAMNKGLIPIVSKEAGLPEKEFIFKLKNLDIASIQDMILKTSKLSTSKLNRLSHQVITYTSKYHSPENFMVELKKILDKLTK
jgi:hypothetical protein